jgi:hypothetical protein
MNAISNIFSTGKNTIPLNYISPISRGSLGTPRLRAQGVNEVPSNSATLLPLLLAHLASRFASQRTVLRMLWRLHTCLT